MKIDFPIPAELSKQLTDTAETMHRIENLLKQLVIIESVKMTVDQRNAFEYQLASELRSALERSA